MTWHQTRSLVFNQSHVNVISRCGRHAPRIFTAAAKQLLDLNLITLLCCYKINRKFRVSSETDISCSVFAVCLSSAVI